MPLCAPMTPAAAAEFSFLKPFSDREQFLPALFGRFGVSHIEPFERIEYDLGYNQPSVLFVVGWSFGCQWEQDRPPAHQNADEADGDRGAVPPSADDEAGAGAQDLPVSLTRHGGRAAEPGVGDGHHVHPDGEGLRLSRRGARLVLAARVVVAHLHHDGGLVLRRGVGGRLADMADRTSSTPIKAASSPGQTSSACSSRMRSRSAWTARARGGTTCSSSGSGGR